MTAPYCCMTLEVKKGLVGQIICCGVKPVRGTPGDRHVLGNGLPGPGGAGGRTRAG